MDIFAKPQRYKLATKNIPQFSYNSHCLIVFYYDCNGRSLAQYYNSSAILHVRLPTSHLSSSHLSTPLSLFLFSPIINLFLFKSTYDLYERHFSLMYARRLKPDTLWFSAKSVCRIRILFHSRPHPIPRVCDV